MELHKNQQLYSEKNTWLNTMLEGFDSVAILILDKSYRYIMLNNGHKKFMKKLLGIDVEIGMNILDIIEKHEKNNMKENFIGRIKEKLSIAFKGKNIVTNEEVLVRENEIEYYQIELVPIKNESGVITQVGICSLDITDNISAMKYFLKRKLDVSEEYEEKCNFLRNISHEIRTPMNGIIGLTDILLKDELNVKQKKYMKSIKDSAAALLENVDKILYNCKTGTNKSHIYYKEFSIYKVIDNIQKMFSAKQQEIEFNINYNLEKNIDKYIIGNELKLQQILINIISNVINLSVCNEIKVNIKIQDTFVDYNNRNGIKLKFEIIYLGKKMNERKNIRECSNSYEITSGLIKDMGGNITINNNNFFKNNITINIPFILGNKFNRNINSIDDKEQDKKEIQKLNFEKEIKILVAEDNLVNQMVISELIKIFGWKSKIVDNGKKAIQALKSDNYALILMDISMPEMNGVEAMKVIKQEKTFKKIPIIALTAYALEEDKEKLIQLGMDDYLSKPIDKEKLYDMVNKHLNFNEEAPKQSDIILNDEYRNGFKRLYKVLDGNTELILDLGNKVVQMFSKQQMNEIIEFANTGEIAELREVIHKLKGAISNFKLIKVTENLNEIKEKAIEGDLNSVYKLVDKINANIKEFENELIKYCDNCKK